MFPLQTMHIVRLTIHALKSKHIAHYTVRFFTNYLDYELQYKLYNLHFTKYSLNTYMLHIKRITH